jgi:hypothetical protein
MGAGQIGGCGEGRPVGGGVLARRFRALAYPAATAFASLILGRPCAVLASVFSGTFLVR